MILHYARFFRGSDAFLILVGWPVSREASPRNERPTRWGLPSVDPSHPAVCRSTAVVTLIHNPLSKLCHIIS